MPVSKGRAKYQPRLDQTWRRVQSLTGAVPSSPGDAPRCELSRTALQQLIDLGVADVNQCQNESPSIQEFLDIECDKPLTYLAYVVYPPRDDKRVSVEGFEVEALTAEECLALCHAYRHADELDYDLRTNGYHLRVWWD